MDTYPYADRDAMAHWMKVLGEEYPHFNTVGETWVTEPAYTAAWQKDSKLSEKNSYLPTVMDFAFFDRINSAKKEETDDWWNGMNRLYNVFCYDYLYPNPKSVMAFVENHDTDRFLGEGKDTLALKQALALLLDRKPYSAALLWYRGVDEWYQECNRWQCTQGLPWWMGW